MFSHKSPFEQEQNIPNCFQNIDLEGFKPSTKRCYEVLSRQQNCVYCVYYIPKQAGQCPACLVRNHSLPSRES